MNLSDSRFDPIHERFVPVGTEKVLELEAKLKAPLPKEYVVFLAHYGGCGFSGDANVSVDGRKLPIFTFFDEHKLLERLDMYSDLTAVGKIAFADDMAGNPYVLDAATGKVFYIDFSVNPPVGTRVATSFNTFLDSIEVQPFD